MQSASNRANPLKALPAKGFMFSGTKYQALKTVVKLHCPEAAVIDKIAEKKFAG
jgi:hypothetical protein